MSALVKLNNISKSYPNKDRSRNEVIRNLSLEIPRGAKYAITGPSGCGKSTLIHLIGGLDQADSGEIIVDCHNLGEKSQRQLASIRNQTIGFIFQKYHLIQHLTAFENTILPLNYSTNPPKDMISIGQQALAEVNLLAQANQYTHTLSGGQQQRLAIARAIVNQPKLLLADEPTAALDEGNSEQIINLINHLNTKHQMTLIIVTHNKEITKHADQVYQWHT